MSHIETFETNETEALRGLDGDLQAVARTSVERTEAITAAQVADLAVSPEGRSQRAAAREAAIRGDAELRTGKKGRPPVSDERLRYRALCEAHDEAEDRFKIAWDKYAQVIAQLGAAGPELDSLSGQAVEQVQLATEVVEHLERAAATFAQAVALADDGQAVMARLGNLVSFNDSPFVNLAAGPRELHDLAKRWRLRLDAESERVGGDPDEEIAEQRARHEAAKYRRDLDTAAAAYRTSTEGSALWKAYAAAMRHHEAEAGEGTAGDTLHYQREQLQRMLNRFYDGAAAQAGLTPQPEQYPQLG
ncbi:MAG TPA: hypothetical protein VMY35_17320 [Phycisphaerae bacterium]|nr:hypothetical protein [Phycisphaerae bacterium]